MIEVIPRVRGAAAECEIDDVALSAGVCEPTDNINTSPAIDGGDKLV